MATDYDYLRILMVKEQLVQRNIKDQRVLEAFSRVERHRFVSSSNLAVAYEDHPLSIGYGQTISQPYMVAYMMEQLNLTGDEKVLEIGTGSGYQTALLSKLVKQVYTIERIPELLKSAQDLLSQLGYHNIYYKVANGTLGWSEATTFHRIIVSAGAPHLPESLTSQLTDNGILLIPVGNEFTQNLIRVKKKGQNLIKETLCPCVFVRLIGKQGW